MMRVLVCAVLAAGVILLAGCVMANAPIVAPIGVDVKGPVAVGDPSVPATKVGKAQAQGIILVGMGDASIAAAAQSAGITRIHHVDANTLNVLGIYARYETIVYGE